MKTNTSLFEPEFFIASRLEGETYEDYKKRQRENKHFLKMYFRYGRDKFINFMKFMLDMKNKQDAKEAKATEGNTK